MLRVCGSSFERSNSTYGVVRAAVGKIGYERFRRNNVGKTLYYALCRASIHTATSSVYKQMQDPIKYPPSVTRPPLLPDCAQ
jgi:hypothetical protein